MVRLQLVARIRFDVAVAADEDVVRKRINAAADRPEDFVKMFTSVREVTAAVHAESLGWDLRVEGPQFIARGSVQILHRDPGSTLAVLLDVNGRGIFALAGPAIGLAASKIQGEATTMLQKEFGSPDP
jgi:hypothetical protein